MKLMKYFYLTEHLVYLVFSFNMAMSLVFKALDKNTYNVELNIKAL